MLLISENSCF